VNEQVEEVQQAAKKHRESLLRMNEKDANEFYKK